MYIQQPHQGGTGMRAQAAGRKREKNISFLPILPVSETLIISTLFSKSRLNISGKQNCDLYTNWVTLPG